MKIKRFYLHIIFFLCAFTSLLYFMYPSVVKAATNSTLQPIICIDNPTSSFLLNSNQLYVSGWALNVSGVKQVQVSLDNSAKIAANIGLERPDVHNVYPNYTNSAKSGYNCNIDTSSITLGQHTLTIEITGNDGATLTQSTTFYKVPAADKNSPDIVCIDSPSSNTSIINNQNQLTVSGWSLCNCGVQKVQVYFDNGDETDAAIGKARPDVNNVFPRYYGASTSGYSCTLNLPSSISDGAHIIKIVSIGYDGSQTSKNITVRKVSEQTMPAKICIDNPTSSFLLNSNQLYVSGWALNVSGVKQVQVSLDNSAKIAANIGLERPDVHNVYPNYTDSAKCGYNCNIDTSSITLGQHTLTIESTGNDGATLTQSATFYKVPAADKNLTDIVCIDNPNNNAIIRNDQSQLNVSGWSLCGCGIQKVQVYFDNANETDAAVGKARPDVNNVFPGYYGGSTSGYSCTLNLPSSISDGTHTIKVVSIGYDGSQTSKSITVNSISEQTMPAKICIDCPNYSQVSGNQIKVYGWSLNYNGVSQVQISIDNGTAQNANINEARPDVNNVFPGYANSENSGYSCNLDISSLSSGVHSVKVVSMSKNGTSTVATAYMYKLPNGISDLSNIVCIDNPSSSKFIKNQDTNILINGWALSPFDVNKVEIYCDNNYCADANIKISRTDVNNVHPGYLGGSTSGYSYLLSIANLSYGAHKISVKSIGNDGSVTIENTLIYKVSDTPDFAIRLYSFLSNSSNIAYVNSQAVALHGGDTHNDCVYFSSSALRDLGVPVPMDMCNTKNYVPYLTSLGWWAKDYNVNSLYPGNICFSVPDCTGYPSHTYVFMGWVNPDDHTLAYVADNQDWSNIHIRSMIDAPGIDAFSFCFHD